MPKNSNEYQKAYQNDWYKKQSKEYKERQKLFKEKRRLKNYEFLIEKRSNPCYCCQEIHPQEIMEFHHIEGKPDRRVGNLLGNSLKRLEEEINKCILVCPNCHTKIHKEILFLI
jgi:hypothetical protein